MKTPHINALALFRNCDRAELTAWFVLISLHLAAVFTLIAPIDVFRTASILGADHPAHAHRVHVFRSALFAGDFPWGYDPQVSAGVVMRPTQDAGAKPQEALGALLHFCTPGQIVKGFLFVTAATFPVWPLIAARLISFPRTGFIWLAVCSAGPMWMYANFFGYFAWGLAAFAFSCFLGPLTLAFAVQFVSRPCWSNYWGTILAGASQFLMHVLGPLLIVPTIPFLAIGLKDAELKWKLAAVALPIAVIALNSWWLIPFVADNLVTPTPLARSTAVYPDDLVYTSGSHLLSALTVERLLLAFGGLALTGYGFQQMRAQCGRLAASTFVVAGLFGVVLKFAGSFIPVVVDMQPSRFLLCGFVFMAFPLALALRALVIWMRVPESAAVVACALGLVALGVWKDSGNDHARGTGHAYTNFAGIQEVESSTTISLPHSVPMPEILDHVTDFIHDGTQPSDRVLLQTRVQCEPKILASEWHREVVGNSYPDQGDPANFLSDQLWGRKLTNWTPADFLTATERWGVDWVIVWSDDAIKLASSAFGTEGTKLGEYTAFRTPHRTDRFLVGEGELTATVNSIELNNLHPDNGLIVLRYRYHPAWTSTGGIPIERWDIPEDAAGFIALRNPPAKVSLKFAPVRVFTARWPQPDSSHDVSISELHP